MDKKTIPNNIEAEQALLGSILLDSTVYTKVANLVNPSDCFLEKHQFIFDAMVALYRASQPVDILSVSARLNGRLNDVGGIGYLTSLLNSVPTPAHAEYYAKEVVEKAQRRKMLDISTRLAERAYDDELNVGEIQSATIRDVTSISTGQAQFKSVGEIFDENQEYFERTDRKQSDVWGIPTGFIQLDRLLGGWHKGGFYVISGNSSVGKTFFLLTILLNLAYRGVGSGLVSLEMTGVQLTDRLLGMISGIPTDALNRRAMEVEDANGRKQWRKLTDAELAAEEQAKETLRLLPIFINDEAIRDATQMRTALLNLKARYQEIEVGALDYLQLMSGNSNGKKNGTRNDELAAESRELKILSNVMPIFALSQKNRDNERRDNRRAFKMADIRDSGGIPQDSDVLIDLYSEDYVNGQEGKLVKETHIVEALIGKDRLSRAMGKRALFKVNPLTRYYADIDLAD